MMSFEIMSEINKLREELKSIQQMSEFAVCEKYNVDEKEEAIFLLKEDLDSLWYDYEELSTIEEREEQLEKEAVRLSFNNPMRQLLMSF